VDGALLPYHGDQHCDAANGAGNQAHGDFPIVEIKGVGDHEKPNR